jgi:hypothetical protein
MSNVIVVLISIVWVANFFAQFIVANYHPDPSINGVFGAVVGGALALTRKADSAKPPEKTPVKSDNSAQGG